jgi:hypothetical protein
MSDTNIVVGGGGGCVTTILTILVLTALFFGLPTPWGLFEIDLFWPGIYLNR